MRSLKLLFPLFAILTCLKATSQIIERVTNINPFGLSVPQNLIVFDNKLYFSANDGTQRELWKTDGTSAGTTMIDINPGGSSNPGQMIEYNGQLIFVATDATGRGLMASDGTQTGTVMIKKMDVVSSFFTPLNGKLYFLGKDGFGTELWVSDGSASGTYMVKDICPGICSGTTGIRVFKNKLYFQGRDSLSNHELWVSDGTAAGTQLFMDFAALGGSNPRSLIAIDSNLYFQTFVNGITEIWVTDGTVSGTQSLLQLNPPTGWNLPDFAGCDGKLYFSLTSNGGPCNLYVSDGTIGGTKPIATTQGLPIEYACFNNKIYFFADQDYFWVSDGTTAGTSWLFDMDTIDNFTHQPANFTVFNNSLFFSAVDGLNGRELWRTDGTAQGTKKEVFPNGGWSSPIFYQPYTRFVEYNGNLFFAAVGDTAEVELWKYSPWSAAISSVQRADVLFNAYPNPASDVLHVTANGLIDVVISNVFGQRIMSATVNKKMSVDISALSPGLYFLSELTSSKVIRFIKQ